MKNKILTECNKETLPLYGRTVKTDRRAGLCFQKKQGGIYIRDNRRCITVQRALLAGVQNGGKVYQFEKTPVDLEDKTEFKVEKPFIGECYKVDNEVGIGSSATLSGEEEEKKPGFIGEAILYAGEPDVEKLPEKYIEGSQDWPQEERKRRIGVVFGINFPMKYLTGSDHVDDVVNKSRSAYERIEEKVPATSVGFCWGYNYKIKGVSKKAEDMEGVLTEEYEWKKGGNPVTDIRKELRSLSPPPYGMMRDYVGRRDDKVYQQISNTSNPVYIHSFDADAPDFETLVKKPHDSGWVKILDAYSEILSKIGSPDMLVGGYNLTSQPEEYENIGDYKHTVRSNAIDLVIRRAVHKVMPAMLYPTEPNFIISAERMGEIRARKGKEPVWGEKTSEGRNLYNSLIKQIKSTASPKDLNEELKKRIWYEPLCSVPTGVKEGGRRLKIEAGKTYDENSLLGAPQSVSGPAKGDVIPVGHQYIVQAQSWAGATRIATAYVQAMQAMGMGSGITKESAIAWFSPVESMVNQLIEGDDIGFELPSDAGTYVGEILEQIKKDLNVIKNKEVFWSMVE